MELQQLKNKRVAIYGFGREGQSVYQFLSRELPMQTFSILNDTPLNDAPENSIVYVGEQVDAQLSQFDVVIKSPGISAYKPAIIHAKQAGVQFTSLVNLWFALHKNATTVCITGSKGKSTTSSWLAYGLQKIGVKAVLGGNVGQPLFDLVDDADIYIIELSSYQTSDFTGQPTVAAVLNLFPEHLDWHQNVANYYRDKCHLLVQTPTTWMVNAQDETLVAQLKTLPPAKQIQWFNQTDGFHHDGTTVYFQRQALVSLEQLKLKGSHNLSNLCACLTLAQSLDYPIHALVSAMTMFCTLEHRLNHLGIRHHLIYIDDSISTTPQSVVAALKAYASQQVTVLVGGYDRGLDWQVLADYLTQQSHVHAVITMPQNGNKIQNFLQNSVQTATSPQLINSQSLQQAVKIAQQITPKQGIILLSPGAPSYGLFNDFKQRGLAFLNYSGLNEQQ